MAKKSPAPAPEKTANGIDVNRVSPYVGGTFAPPLTDETLKEYGDLIEQMGMSPVRDAMLVLLLCCQQWWKLPEPQHSQKSQHPSGTGFIVPLESAHAETLDEYIPWKHELEAMKGLFEGINSVGQRDIRNAAFHLLWCVIELDNGREPITKDKLGI